MLARQSCQPAQETMERLQPTNRLLEALPPACRQRILDAATFVDLAVGRKLYTRDERPRFLYLLTAGMASVVFTSKNGTGIELATLGNEGLVGWGFLFGPALDATDCSIQVNGAGYRVPLASVQREFDTAPETRQRILNYARHQSATAFQLSACNRLHRAEARFARWLLMVGDRLGNDDLAMTQEFMAMMLGTRRTTLAEVCAALGRAGALTGRRGGVRIADRAVLEHHACECYGILRERFDALYGDPLPGAENIA